MRAPVFRTDDEWRTVVVMHLVHLRCSVFELGLLIAVIALGISAAKWWDGAPITGAIIALLGAAFFYKDATREWTRLANLHVAATTEETPKG